MPHIVGKSIAVPSSECLLERNHTIWSIAMWKGQGKTSRPQKHGIVRSSSSTFDSKAAISADVAGEIDDDEEVDFADLPCKAIPRSERMDFSGASCMYRKMVSPERLAMVLILFVSKPKAA